MIEETFNLAANYIQNHHDEFNKENLLKFYALYKTSTTGPIDQSKNPRPSFFRITERSKWDAWNELGEMPKEDAMKKYADLLTSLVPEWEEKCSDSGNKSSFGGASVSRPKTSDIILNEADKTIEDFIKEGNIDKFKIFFSSIHDDELNTLDENKMGLIHWAADRGNEEILKIILSHPRTNVNFLDGDGQTALHYASCCGHKSCISLLLSHGIDKNIRDNDGSSCIDVAFDDEIKALLS